MIPGISVHNIHPLCVISNFPQFSISTKNVQYTLIGFDVELLNLETSGRSGNKGRYLLIILLHDITKCGLIEVSIYVNNDIIEGMESETEYAERKRKKR